ncbi:trichohyalin-like [Narcine bancroftii]|uniref:trichohyalin-like n=1 Tax=Narcine bancroftii TaxID=1343680 RepID=UPI0038316CAF
MSYISEYTTDICNIAAKSNVVAEVLSILAVSTISGGLKVAHLAKDQMEVAVVQAYWTAITSLKEMGTQGSGRKRIANRERLSAEDDTLNLIAREAEARLAAKRAARAEAREIRMKELERQQKEIYQVQKKYYGMDSKWGDIEQWMEDSEKYSRRFRRHTSVSDEDDWTSVASRSSTRADYQTVGASGGANGFDELSCGSGASKRSSRSSRYSDDSLKSTKERLRKEAMGSYYSDLPVHSTGLSSKSHTASQNGTRVSAYDGSASRRYSTSSSRAPSEYNCLLGSSSRTSSRASSARASPVVEERSEKDFIEKGSRAASSLSAATFASLGGTSSRRGSGETTTSIDTEGSIREIKDSLMEVEEKYKKAMVSNAQLDNEKANLMYQVDTLREDLLELEEQLAEVHRGHEEKTKELERQKHAYSILQHQFEEIKETLKEREKMLTEIKELNQKQRFFAQEISDLQETLEWKDKKIGALERQKEYSEGIRIDRDELRNEVVILKERLKAHGLLTNGEAEHIGKEGSALRATAQTRTQTEVQQQSSNDGPLGESCGLQMRNEILKAVEQRGDVQNTATDEQMEETGNREMLMDNMEEKGKTENCEELTEIGTPTVTVRDNGNADQIGLTKSNLDEGEQNSFDTQNTGFKEVHEKTSSSPTSEERIQTHGCREGSESENENDPEGQGNQLQEKTNHTLNDEEKLQSEQFDLGLHRNLIREIHTEVENDLDVHNDIVGTGVDHQMIVEKTQQIVQNVVEKAVQFIQQMSGHELQENTQEMKETICVGIGSIEVKGENLTRTQERSDESQQVKEKELDGVMIQETEHEQAITGVIELHSPAQESEISSMGLQVKNEEARQLLIIPSDQNDQHRLSREGINEMDEAEKEGESDQDRKKHIVPEELEEVEEMADKVKEGNDLIGTALQELEEIKEVACYLREERGLMMRDEVKNAVIHHEDQGEAEPNLAAKPGDGAGPLLQQQKMEGSFEHEFLQKITVSEGKKESETENNTLEFEDKVQRIKENEVKSRELKECKEEHKGLSEGKVKSHGRNESKKDIKESDSEGHGIDEGTDKETGMGGISHDGKSWEIGKVNGLESEKTVEGVKANMDKGSSWDESQPKEENDSKVHVSDLYETKGSNEDIVKNQDDCEAKWETQEENIEMQVPEDISTKFKEDENKFQHHSLSRFRGTVEDGDEIKSLKEESEEARNEEECEVKSKGKEGEEVKWSKCVEGNETESLAEKDIEAIEDAKGGEVKSPRQVEGDEVKNTRELDNGVKGVEGGEVQSSRFNDEDEVRSPKDVKKTEEHQIKSPREDDNEITDEEEDEVRGLTDEVKVKNEGIDEVICSREGDDVRDEKEDQVKNIGEEFIEIKSDGAGEINSPKLELQNYARNAIDEELKIKGEENVIEKGNVVIGSNIDDIKGPMGEMDEDKDPIEESGKVRNKEGDIIMGPKDEDAGGAEGPIDADVKSIAEDGYEVKGLRTENGEEDKSCREEEDNVKSPRGEEKHECEGIRDKEDKIKSDQNNEGHHGTITLGRPQGKENEICVTEESNEAKLNDLLSKKEKLGEIMAEEIECHLKEQVNESCKTDELQEKSFEKMYEGTSKTTSKSIHQVKDSKIEQVMEREEQTGITEEPTAQMQISGEKETKMLAISRKNETFGDNAHVLEEVVSSTEENDERARFELNKGQEQLAQDSVMDTVALEDFDNQRNQESEEVDSVKGERDASGTNKEQMIQGSETNKTRIEDTTNIQNNTEELKIKDKDDPEEGYQFDWDEEMNDMLQDEIRDDGEVPECEEGRGKASTESETEPKCLMKAESSQNLTPTTDCSRDAANDEQVCQRRNSSSRQSNIPGGQQEGGSQRDMSSISGAEGNMKEADEEMRCPETAKDSKRKSKSKDDCLLSYFRVNTFVDEKEALLEQIKKLKTQLEEKTRSGKAEKETFSDAFLENGMEVQVIEVQRDANRQISEYKFKLTKTEQEITALEQNLDRERLQIIRLESQVLRYKTAAENAEKVEDELKAEKRKLQREVRSALDKIEELEMSNSHLSKRLEKMKANRSALLSQQ